MLLLVHNLNASILISKTAKFPPNFLLLLWHLHIHIVDCTHPPGMPTGFPYTETPNPDGLALVSYLPIHSKYHVTVFIAQKCINTHYSGKGNSMEISAMDSHMQASYPQLSMFLIARTVHSLLSNSSFIL